MKKSMKLWDVVFMNVTAVIGLRWIPIAAGYGAASIPLWILAAILFFIPVSLIACELATTWPDQGGMYVWVREAYGEKAGFLTSWFYYTNNLFYYPSLLTFIAVVMAFLFNPALANNKAYVISVILIVFWGVTLYNLKGTRVGKWLTNLSGTLGTILPGLIIIVVGFASVLFWGRPIASNYSAANWIPNLGSQSNLAFLSTLMFAMAGIEITPILAGETEDPQRTFPKAVVISAAFIAGIYIIGTVAVTFIMTPDKIGAASGIMDAMQLVGKSVNLPWLAFAVALTLTIGNFGGISVWAVAPLKMLFESTKEGIFPPSLTKLNKNEMPQNAMILQAVIVTVIVLLTSFLPSVNSFYGVLVIMTTVNYFIPYFILFPAFIKLRKLYPDRPRPFKVPGEKFFPMLITIFGFFSVALAIGFSFIPSSDLKTTFDIATNEIRLICGPVVFLIIGLLLYSSYKKKMSKSEGKSTNI